jgi:hypothetical protein
VEGEEKKRKESERERWSRWREEVSMKGGRTVRKMG